jgi:general secretion pathway protein J
MVMAENQPTRLQVVSYRVNADGVLTRRESAGTRELTELDNLWQAALSDTDTSNTNGAVALQSNVQGMSMRLWVPGTTGTTTAANAGDWVAAAGTSSSGSAIPPIALEVSLTLRGQQVPLVKSFLLGAL